MIRILAVTLLLLVSGCAGAVSPPFDPASDLQQRCERAGHWWRPDIAGGYCERT